MDLHRNYICSFNQHVCRERIGGVLTSQLRFRFFISNRLTSRSRIGDFAIRHDLSVNPRSVNMKACTIIDLGIQLKHVKVGRIGNLKHFPEVGRNMTGGGNGRDYVIFWFSPIAELSYTG